MLRIQKRVQHLGVKPLGSSGLEYRDPANARHCLVPKGEELASTWQYMASCLNSCSYKMGEPT